MSAQLEARTKTFALDVVCFCADLPYVPEIGDIRGQLQRSSTSVAANLFDKLTTGGWNPVRTSPPDVICSSTMASRVAPVTGGIARLQVEDWGEQPQSRSQLLLDRFDSEAYLR